jgi:energy-coupling factor transporter ATP-binding protein EcfA2
VHSRIVAERDQGTAVIIVSSELDEIYALADRIAVMYEGKITGFRPPTVPVEELGLLMAGVGDESAAEAGEGALPGELPADAAMVAVNPALGTGPVVSGEPVIPTEPRDKPERRAEPERAEPE